MKLFALLSVAVYGQTTVNPPTTIPTTIDPPTAFACKTCVAGNVNDCLGNATIVECQENETTCEVTMRKRRGGTYFVQMGCKALDACLNNKSNNAKGPWKQQECKPYNNIKIENSVCRQCCDGGADCVETNFLNGAGTDGTQSRQNWINDFVTQDDPSL